jgi:hypothetical protein
MKFPTFVLAVVVVVSSFGSVVEAYNSWNGYHWNITALQTIKNPLKIGDNVSSTWDKTLAGASYDWNKSVVKNKIVPGSSNSNCDPVSGRIEVCNGQYGENGWLGLTQVWVTPGTPHISQATIRLNDTYFAMESFTTTGWKNETLCHEIGHTYGLDHQDTNFDNSNLGTCLDFTTDPDGTIYGQLSNEHPNQLDYDTIQYVYNHKHSRPRNSTVAVSVTEVENSINDWGISTGKMFNGKEHEFVKELKDGGKIITHVHWK